MRNPEFIAEAKRIRAHWELPISLDIPSDPFKRVCSALKVFRFEKLSGHVLNSRKGLIDHSEMNCKMHMKKVHSLLRLTYQDEIMEWNPTKREVSISIIPPIAGWSNMPPPQLVVSNTCFLLKNLGAVAKACGGEQPLSKEIASALEHRGFPLYNSESWQRLREGQSLPEETIGYRRKQIAKIKPTKSDFLLVIQLQAGLWILEVFFRWDIRNLIKRFSLGPEWLWTLYVFLVTDVNPIEISCIPFLNVGISDGDLKGNFSPDVGLNTTNRDVQFLLAMMQQEGLKTIRHNYPYKNLEENLKIEELSKEKPRVVQEIRKVIEEAKEKARKEGKQFFKDENEEHLDFIHGPETDKDIATSVFPDKSEVSDELLKKEADRIKHRRYRHKKRKESRFGPSSDSRPGK